MRGFFDGKTFESVVRVTNFKVFAISEKIEKSMPKWLQKSSKNHLKSTPGAPNVDLFIDPKLPTATYPPRA